jgi:hypothetical protein
VAPADAYAGATAGFVASEFGSVDVGVPVGDVGPFTAALANAFGVCFEAGDSGYVNADEPDLVKVDSFGFLPHGNIFEGDGIFQPPLLQPVVATVATTKVTIA